MEFRLMHFYPDLMSLYGSYANVAVLKRFLEGLGHEAAVEAVLPGQTADLSEADFLYMGAGTERGARAAIDDLARYAKPLRKAVEDGVTLLFAGTAMELLGQTVTEPDGRVYKGLGLTTFSTVHGRQRIVGDVYGRTSLFPEPVVGFMNKCGIISGVETPFLSSCSLGFGNEKSLGPEGFQWKNLFASELTGPLLVKNPRLLETVARRICQRREAAWPEKLPEDSWQEQGYQTTEEQLRLRCQMQ